MRFVCWCPVKDVIGGTLCVIKCGWRCRRCHLYVCIYRTLPLFVWHRQNWNVVYPNVDLEQVELEDLSAHGTYIAGFTDASVEGRTELYDMFINGWPVTYPIH